MPETSRLRLTKHHGAGNDFLVLLDAGSHRPISAAETRALCHRHLGIGADGLLRAMHGQGGAALAMELRNADGSMAEMSGNGIRCLVQAAVLSGWVPPGTVEVDTAAGRRQVEYRPGAEAGAGFARVDMGTAVLGAELVVDEARVRAARSVDMGNPHLVLLVDGPADDAMVGDVGPRLERSVSGGANVEMVWPVDQGELGMRVWERGVGETLACGTGTCAAAAAAANWGLGERRFLVHNPGGLLEAELTDQGVVLGGPTMMVGEVSVDETVLAALVTSMSTAAAKGGPVADVAVDEVPIGEVRAGR
jgi:diaminopimelate epimerase